MKVIIIKSEEESPITIDAEKVLVITKNSLEITTNMNKDEVISTLTQCSLLTILEDVGFNRTK